MNTTWYVEPHGWGWTLFVAAIVATIALITIAVRMWWPQRIAEQHPQNNSSRPDVAVTRNSRGWIAWVAIVLSIISCLGCFFKTPNEGGDASVLVAALGVMVTLLVTWNIWQTIDTRNALEDVVVLRTQFNDLRQEIDVLHGIHEAYVLDALGEDNRRAGHFHRGFDYFLRSAFIFARDLEHYDTRFMSEISSMRICVDDLHRNLSNRETEISQFNLRSEQIVRDLENLRQQANNLQRFSEQAQRELNVLINNIIALSNTPATPEQNSTTDNPESKH
ncbi:MAG: MFS transporter [Bacteroidales bacterium]|nr:MFS transporter [Bacteroidales bacterium]